MGHHLISYRATKTKISVGEEFPIDSRGDNIIDENLANLSDQLQKVALVLDEGKAKTELKRRHLQAVNMAYGPALFNDKRPRKKRSTKRKLEL